MYDNWMKHVKLPHNVVQRIKNYNEYIWQKYQGLDGNVILEDLPSTTRQEILEFLLTEYHIFCPFDLINFSMLEAVEIFPNDEVGLFTSILKDFRLIIITQVDITLLMVSLNEFYRVSTFIKLEKSQKSFS